MRPASFNLPKTIIWRKDLIEEPLSRKVLIVTHVRWVSCESAHITSRLESPEISQLGGTQGVERTKTADALRNTGI